MSVSDRERGSKRVHDLRSCEGKKPKASQAPWPEKAMNERLKKEVERIKLREIEFIKIGKPLRHDPNIDKEWSK